MAFTNLTDKILNKTSFFRTLEAYEKLKDYLGKRHNLERRLEFLSLGCSTGEEVYSFKYYFSDLFNISATGVDNVKEYIEVANQGIYVVPKRIYEFARDMFLPMELGKSILDYANYLRSLASNLRMRNIGDTQIINLASEIQSLYNDYFQRSYMHIKKPQPIETFLIVKIRQKYQGDVKFVPEDALRFIKNIKKNRKQFDVIQTTYVLMYLPDKERNEVVKHLIDVGKYFVTTDCCLFDSYRHRLSYLYYNKNLCVLKKKK